MSHRKDKNPYAVVVGLESIVGLQTARILRRRGIPVVAVTDDPTSFCCRTNACERIVTAQPGEGGLVHALVELSELLDEKPVLFPCTDMSVLGISRNRNILGDAYHILLPSAEVVELLVDKVNFYKYAQSRGLPIPKTFFLRSRSEAQYAAAHLRFPCILKPPAKTPEWLTRAKTGVYKLDTAEEFLARYETCREWADTLMVQEWVPGPDENLYSCNCYFDAASRPLATFIARKLRQWPPEAGTSSLGEECRNDVVLTEALRLFSGVPYRGLGYVELKKDARSGAHYIIEPNIGRPTGRSAIAEAGGVELLYLMYCDALGRPLPSGLKQTYGDAKWIYWRRDLQAALYYWRRGELSLREWWASWRGKKCTAVFSWSDPVPFFADLMRVAALLVTGGKGEAVQQAGATLAEPDNATKSELVP